MSIKDRLSHAWSALTSNRGYGEMGNSYGYSIYQGPTRIGRGYGYYGNEKNIISTVYTRLSIDVAQIKICHAKVDDNESFEEIIDDDLNYCLTQEANIDQSARAFIQDAAMTMFDEGVVAMIPMVATDDVRTTNIFDVKELRCGKVTQWYPEHVTVSVYNDKTGVMDEITLPKRHVAIAENPFFRVMNEPNSTVKRLMRKINLLDESDENSNGSKLDLIMQVPYAVKSEQRAKLVNDRRSSMEQQLRDSKYGVAWMDGTEKVVQLNRSVENNLFEQTEKLTDMLFNQLGLTKEVFQGTADEQTMLNYLNGTIEPIVGAITDALQRAFLTKTAKRQGQRILYIREPFKLVPVNNLADIADKFTRNEILTSNEVRAIIGFRPSNDPRANELRNKNIAESKDQLPPEKQVDEVKGEGGGLITEDLLRSRSKNKEKGGKS